MKDYKQQPDGDLDFTTGDLLIAESTYQHQRDLLYSDNGHIRQKAEAGVGAVNYRWTTTRKACSEPRARSLRPTA